MQVGKNGLICIHGTVFSLHVGKNGLFCILESGSSSSAHGNGLSGARTVDFALPSTKLALLVRGVRDFLSGCGIFINFGESE